MRIVMDEAGDAPVDLLKTYNIRTVPINITFGTKEYLSGVNMSHADFYEMIKEVGDHNFPKSSQPTPFQFAEVYRSLLKEGADEILTITVSEKLSGTYASAVAAIQELEGEATFNVFDSRGGSAAQGYMVIEAARMASAGADTTTILNRLAQMRDNQTVTFLINSLEYAVKGGRVSSLQSTMASLLRIKPIMNLEDGLIVEAGKVRTYGKALDYIVDFVHNRVGEQPVKVAYIHANDPNGVEELQKRTQGKLNMTEAFAQDMAISVAINLGPGALGIVAIPEP